MVNFRAMHRASSALLCALVLLSAAAAWADEPLSDRVVSYRIEATLKPETHVVSGWAEMTIRNTASVPMEDVALHLYANAFRGFESEWLGRLKEEMPDQAKVIEDGGRFGRIDLLELRTSDGVDLTGEDTARTVYRAELPTAIAPGDVLTLEARWDLHVPKAIARLGRTGNHYLIAQWFPKFGVFSDAGWHCKTYQTPSEYFSDFGSYEVAICVPEDYLIGATGVVAERVSHGEGRKTFTFQADDVVDFAWTASPDYVEHVEKVGETELRFLYLSWHAKHLDRLVESATAAVNAFGEWFGPYPYPQLTVVDAPLGTTGMEYPMFVTAGGMHWMELPFTGWLEDVTIHEVGHQWWQSIVATDETTHAWLDEGVNSYWTSVLLEELYGPTASLVNYGPLQLSELTSLRQSLAADPAPAPIALAPADYPKLESYVAMTYMKTALALWTLDRHVGRERMEEVFREYFQRHRFSHPGPAELQAVMQDVLGEEAEWFWGDALHKATAIDLEAVSCSARPEDEGFFNSAEARRIGALALPAEVLLTFADGSEKRLAWDTTTPVWRYAERNASAIQSLVLDPDERILLDTNPINNSVLAEPPPSGMARQRALLTFIGALLTHLLGIAG